MREAKVKFGDNMSKADFRGMRRQPQCQYDDTIPTENYDKSTRMKAAVRGYCMCPYLRTKPLRQTQLGGQPYQLQHALAHDMSRGYSSSLRCSHLHQRAC